MALFRTGHKRKKSRSRSNSRDRRKRPSGPSGSEDTAHSLKESVVPAQPKLPSSATQGITPRPSGAGSTYAKRTVGDDCEPLGGRQPGDGIVPQSALSVETLDGQLVYEGTKEEPIIKFETCRAELKSMGKAMRLWTVDLLEVEIAGLKDKSRPSGPWSPWQNTLPRLPKWGSPNGWDYWERPWAYMDAPDRHSAIKVQSAHSKLAACVTIAVLVNCEREPQYFPNLDVAKSAAAAPTWRGHMARAIDGSGNLNSRISVPKAAKMVQPPHFEGPNVAVEALFNMWDSFQKSKLMWRPNPEMPRGDVTPEGCRRTLTVAQLSEQRPVKSVPPTQPLHLSVVPAAPHVDKTAFPALPSSSRDGIGGIPESKDFPKGTMEGFQAAFKKPDRDTVVPRVSSGKTSVPPSATTTVTTAGPAVTKAVPTTATTTTSAPGSSAIMGRKTLDPQVTMTRLSPKLVESARVKLTAKANSSQTGQEKADGKAPSQEKAMECDVPQDSGSRSHSRTRTDRSRTHSKDRDSEKGDTKGKTSSAPVPHKSRETERKSSHQGSTAVSTMLLKAGGVQPPKSGVGPVPRYTPDKEYKVDYSKEPCPAPAFQLDQPRGSHLEGNPEQPKSTWRADPNMSMATLQGHLEALAQAGSQHALYRSQQGMLWTRTEAMRVWDRSNDAFWRIAHEPVFIDEGHAGTVMTTHVEIQRRNEEMKADLRTARRDLDKACQKTRDALKANDIQDKLVLDLKSQLKEAEAARDEARAEVEQQKDSYQQLLNSSGQGAAEAAMVELNHQLTVAKQQLAKLGSAESVRSLTERCTELENSLQLSNEWLRETRDASGLTQLQEQLDTTIEECDGARKREDELIAEGRKLETQYNELKSQLATTRVELESKLRVADVELESKHRQYEREHEFAQEQKAEVERLRSNLNEVREELKAEKAKLVTLQAQLTPAPTMAQYQTMPPGQFQGSPMQTGTMPQGHYSPTVNVTASPGQVGTLAGFAYQGTPAQAPPVHGSPQAPGPQFFLKQPMFVPQEPQPARPQQVQSQPEDPVVSSAGPTE